MKKKECYKVDDHCETPVIYSTLKDALDAIEGIVEGIDFNFPITITKIEMTDDEFDNVSEF